MLLSYWGEEIPEAGFRQLVGQTALIEMEL